MTIKLITKENYKTLLDIQKEYPSLTFQNKGYESLDLDKLTDDDVLAHETVDKILQKSIKGFRKFNHFKINERSQTLTLRFQYDYGADNESISFIGVGYIALLDLYKGFNS